MRTECTKSYRSFQALGRREIVTDFSGGTITSDGGALLFVSGVLKLHVAGRLENT